MRWLGVVLLGLVWTLPFLSKPLHIDEESYLFIARAVADHPLAAYDWWRPWQLTWTPAPHSLAYAHPPLHIWTLALLTRGLEIEALWLLRLCQLPWVVLLLGSFSALSRRFLRSPLLAGLATLAFSATPTTALVLQQSLMIDLPMAALSLAGLALLVDGDREDRPRRWWLAGILLGLAALTKYPALLLLPLTLLRLGPEGSRRLWHPRWAALLPALGIPLAWQVWTWLHYGTPHLLSVLEHAGEVARSPLQSRALGLLAHLGLTAFVPPAVLMSLADSRATLRKLLVAGALTMAGAQLCILALDPGRLSPGDLLDTLADGLVGRVPELLPNLALLLLALFFGGLALQLPRARTAAERWLSTWAVLLLLGIWLTHNFVGARYLILASPALHLLLWRRLEPQLNARLIPLAFLAAVIGGLVTARVCIADLELARAYPELADELERALQGRSVALERVWFSGEWGFRAELEARGARMLPPGVPLGPDDWLVAPELAAPGDLSAAEPRRFLWSFTADAPPGLRIGAPGAGIGLQSEVIGLLPYGWGIGPLERLRVWGPEQRDH